jgi:hypothetical protein
MAKKKNREQQDARTVDKILDELRNSALHVPIVIVEGRDDVKFYREIAYHQLAASQTAFDFVGVVKETGQREGGGRNNLLGLFGRVKNEPGLKRKVLFFADRDFEVFTGIPPVWEGIHFTTGYAIENDLFADGQPQRFLYPSEQLVWQHLLDGLCNWFAGQIRLGLDGQRGKMNLALSMMNPNDRKLVQEAEECPDSVLLAQIKADFTRLTRGKHLFGLLTYVHQERKEEQLLDNPKRHFWQECINRGLENNNSCTHRIGEVLWASAVGGPQINK